MSVATTTVFLFVLILFPLDSESLECINSTSYMDRVLVKPRSSECRMKSALCVKTMQISQNTDGSPKVLSIHRECFELEPPIGYREGKSCLDSFGTKCLSLQILVYSPRMIPSHVSFVANIANLLADRGHKVVVIDNVLRSDIPNRLNVTAVDKVITVKTSKNVAELLADKSIPSKLWRMKNEPEEQKEVMQNLGELFLEQCNYLMTNEKMFDELRKVDLDFGIHEVFDVCGIGIFEKLGLRNSVILSSTGVRDIVNEALGISGPLQDSSILSDYGGSVPILGTRRNLKFHSAWRNFFEIQSKQLEQSFNFDSSFEDLLRYSNLMFLNTHELTDTQRPWSRRVHEIGGISFKTPKLLDDEYINLFSNYSTVVLVSFGTTTPSLLMPEDYKNTLISVFLKLPKVLFIWKYEKEDQFTKEYNGKNVIFKNYVPQVDLLESKRISLFITHGGQNSLLEAFHSNTRTLIIPLFGDQHRNAQISLENGLSLVLKKEDLTNDEMNRGQFETSVYESPKCETKFRNTFN
ncbi:hypothetical protein CAEBREN_12572 [Caenorhabditis brenneri]|uniref:glucuronosyltransferase n=1 Tax=Caenorhabditis brenneri TaxID=135651 RepID=G0MP89_CAEBE|nr:hypothetical protein CAEBREN_12572 [Caenorhabditis brenneri]